MTDVNIKKESNIRGEDFVNRETPLSRQEAMVKEYGTLLKKQLDRNIDFQNIGYVINNDLKGWGLVAGSTALETATSTGNLPAAIGTILGEVYAVVERAVSTHRGTTKKLNRNKK